MGIVRTEKTRDWGLVIAGILLVLCALFCVFAPGVALVALAMSAGVAFLVSGICNLVSYIRFSKLLRVSAWTLAYAIVDIIIGLMLLIHPLVLSAVLLWMLGVFFVGFGVFEIFAALLIRRVGVNIWGWGIFSGVVGILCGVCFFLYPESFVVYLAVFVLLRGISMIIYGVSASKMMR